MDEVLQAYRLTRGLIVTAAFRVLRAFSESSGVLFRLCCMIVVRLVLQIKVSFLSAPSVLQPGQDNPVMRLSEPDPSQPISTGSAKKTGFRV